METKDENLNKDSIEKLIQLNKVLEELEIKTIIQKQCIETLLSSSNNLGTNDFEIDISICLFSSLNVLELKDDPFYECSSFGTFLSLFDKKAPKGYYILDEEIPNESFCATLICLREYADLTLEQLLSIETIWYEVNIQLQNTNDKRFQK